MTESSNKDPWVAFVDTQLLAKSVAAPDHPHWNAGESARLDAVWNELLDELGKGTAAWNRLAPNGATRMTLEAASGGIDVITLPRSWIAKLSRSEEGSPGIFGCLQLLTEDGQIVQQQGKWRLRVNAGAEQRQLTKWSESASMATVPSVFVFAQEILGALIGKL